MTPLITPAAGFIARWRQGVSVAWPLVAGSLSSLLLSAADTAILGHWSTAALSAMAIAGSLTLVVTAVLNTFGIATQIVTAQWVGAKRDAAVLLRTGLRHAAAATVPFLAVLGLCGGPLLHLIGGDVASQVDAVRVLLWLLPSIALTPLAGVYRGWIVGLGATRIALWYAALVNGANIALDLVLVFGAGLGAVGSALGTSLASALGLAFVAIRARRVKHSMATHPRRPSDSFEGARAIRRVAWPDMVFGAASYGAEVAIIAAVSAVSSLDVAAYRVISTTVAILFVLSYSIGNALGVLVGQRLGAGDQAGARAWVWPMSALLAQALLLVGIWPALLGTRWFALFSGDPEVVSRAASVSWMWLGVLPAMGVSLVLASIIRASGDTRSMMWIGVTANGVVCVSLAWLLGVALGWQLPGIALATTAGWCVRAGLSLLRARLGGLWRIRQ